MNLAIKRVIPFPEGYDCRGAYQMTLNKALKSDRANSAMEAAEAEMGKLIKLKCWRYLMNKKDAHPSIHTSETPCSMFVKDKSNSEGVFLLYKARLVNGGHRTNPLEYDPFEKSSPTIPIEIFFMQIGNAVYEGYEMESFDTPTAYLHAELQKGKYHVMRMDKVLAAICCKVDPQARKFLQKDGTLLVEVQRALYGLPESAKLWYEYLAAVLKNIGYKQCPNEPCLFRKQRNNNKEISVLSVYVDDVFHTYRGERMRDELYAGMRNGRISEPTIQRFKKDGDVISHLGISILKLPNRRLFLSQPGYTNEILEKYQPKKSYKTPCNDQILQRVNKELLESERCDLNKYVSKLMKLMYLGNRTRPDILPTLSILSTKMKNPSNEDMEKLDRVIGYIYDTKNLGITVRFYPDSNFELFAYFDAAWAVHQDLKGHSGILITLGYNAFPVMCKSMKQRMVSKSSTEAELIAVFDGLDYLLWLREVYLFFGYENKPITIFQDNTSAITLSYMGRTSSNSNSKYIDLRYFYIKQYLDANVVTMKYLSTDQMLADFFASPRFGGTFKEMRRTILHTEPQYHKEKSEK